MTPGVRPPHLRAAPIASVLLGGAVGAAGREGLSLAIPDVGNFPVSIGVVNLLGAFLLGYLYEAVTRFDVSSRTRTYLALLLGTGFCGGFTTYSALATDTAILLRDGFAGAAALYAFGTVVVGAAFTWAGIACANRARVRRSPPAASQGAGGRA